MLYYKKAAAQIILVILSVAAAFGGWKIYSFAENIKNNTNVFFATAENDIVGVKYNEKTRNEAKSAAKRILDSGIKINVSEISAIEDKIICYTKNVYLELDRSSMCPILLFYECAKNVPELPEDKCRMMAMQFALRNIPRKTKVNGAEIIRISNDENVFSYKILFGEKTVFVSLRSDTGSIVYYDAAELF